VSEIVIHTILLDEPLLYQLVQGMHDIPTCVAGILSGQVVDDTTHLGPTGIAMVLEPFLAEVLALVSQEPHYQIAARGYALIDEVTFTLTVVAGVMAIE
jgi:hypothetical protein